jgi:hypothetical protein
LSEDLIGHPNLLHSLQVTQPTYPLPLYAGVTDLHSTTYCDRYTESQRTVPQ